MISCTLLCIFCDSICLGITWTVLYLLIIKWNVISCNDLHFIITSISFWTSNGLTIDVADNYIHISLHWPDVELHPDISKQFWDPQHWPKHVLVRYTWLVLLLLRLISTVFWRIGDWNFELYIFCWTDAYSLKQIL